MAGVWEAGRAAKKALGGRPWPARWAGLIHMAANTGLVFAVPLLRVKGLGWEWLIPGALFVHGLIGLFLNAPALATARGEGARLFGELTGLRVAAMALLAALPAAAAYGVIRLGMYADVHWAGVLLPLMQDGVYQAIGAVLAAVAASALCLFFLAVSVFARQMTLLMLEEEDAIPGSVMIQQMRNGLLYAFSPVRLGLSALGWGIMGVALTLAGILGYQYLAGDWPRAATALEGLWAAVRLLPKWFMERPLWLRCALASLAGVWLTGLGIPFWPRFLVKGVCYHTDLIRDNGAE